MPSFSQGLVQGLPLGLGIADRQARAATQRAALVASQRESQLKTFQSLVQIADSNAPSGVKRALLASLPGFDDRSPLGKQLGTLLTSNDEATRSTVGGLLKSVSPEGFEPGSSVVDNLARSFSRDPSGTTSRILQLGEAATKRAEAQAADSAARSFGETPPLGPGASAGDLKSRLAQLQRMLSDARGPVADAIKMRIGAVEGRLNPEVGSQRPFAIGDRLVSPSGNVIADFSTEDADALSSDLFDDRGALKTETVNSIRRLSADSLGVTFDATGNLVSGGENLPLFRQATSRANALLRSGGETDIIPATNRAIEEAIAKRPPRQLPPLTPQKRAELQDSLVQIDETIPRIEEAIFDAVPGGTGVGSGLRQIVNNVFGQANSLGANFKTPFPETAESRAALQRLERTLQQSLVLNTRFATTEQEFLRQQIPTPEEWFNDPQTAATKLRGFRDYFIRKERIASKRLGLDDPLRPETLGDVVAGMPLNTREDAQRLMRRFVALNPAEQRVVEARLRRGGFLSSE